MSLILYAVPGFFLLILIEILVEKWRNTDYYRVSDSLTSLATGTINQLVNVSTRLLPFTVYALIYDHIAIWQLSNSSVTNASGSAAAVWVLWIVAFVLYDFCYYWNHRLGHEMNLLWAAHVVHHSSEEYNLTTALRQTGTSFFSFVFYLPMAVLGFDPVIVITVGSVNLIYQFWVHTQHIGKLGWAEKWLVTPSNHRGHHAQNDIYIDRNYGGVFILWDRLFSTYQDELDHDKPIFGIRGAVKSWNPLWVNFQIYEQLFKDALRTKNWWHKLSLWFRRTGWRPPDVESQYPLEKNALSEFVKYSTKVSAPIQAHCILHYISTAALGLVYSLMASSLSLQQGLILVGFVMFSCYCIGALLSNKYYGMEYLRLVTLCAMSLIIPLPQWLNISLISVCVISLPLLYIGRQSNNADAVHGN